MQSDTQSAHSGHWAQTQPAGKSLSGARPFIWLCSYCGLPRSSHSLFIDGTWSKSSPDPTAPIKTSQTQPPLKRSRSSISTMPDLPNIPRLSGDIILEVFTHRSIRFAGAPANEEYGDNERLASLGEKAFDLAVSDALFRKRPMLKAEDIDVSNCPFCSLFLWR